MRVVGGKRRLCQHGQPWYHSRGLCQHGRPWYHCGALCQHGPCRASTAAGCGTTAARVSTALRCGTTAGRASGILRLASTRGWCQPTAFRVSTDSPRPQSKAEPRGFRDELMSLIGQSPLPHVTTQYF